MTAETKWRDALRRVPNFCVKIDNRCLTNLPRSRSLMSFAQQMSIRCPELRFR